MDGWKKEIQQQQCVREGSGFSLPQNQSADLTNEKLIYDRRGVASLSHRIKTDNECSVLPFPIVIVTISSSHFYSHVYEEL